MLLLNGFLLIHKVWVLSRNVFFRVYNGQRARARLPEDLLMSGDSLGRISSPLFCHRLAVLSGSFQKKNKQDIPNKEVYGD